MIKVTILVSLYRCSSFIKTFLDYAVESEGLETTEFLLLHNDPQPDETAIIKEYLHRFPQVRHIEIPVREGLYATWNRGIKLAQGEYLAVWNVDDIRNSDSVTAQSKALDGNKDAMLCYGDFYGTTQHGKYDEIFYSHPEWSKTHPRKYEVVGCFPMWRKSVHDKVGYFDENFKLVADYEFLIRVALNYPLVKVGGILGYCLVHQPHKLSSQKDVQVLERTAVQLRYGLYRHMDLFRARKAAATYKVDKIINFQKEVDVKEFVKDYPNNKGDRLPLFTISPFYSLKQESKRVVKKLIRYKSQ
jgi:GT2 family glycosyltransferase